MLIGKFSEGLEYERDLLSVLLYKVFRDPVELVCGIEMD